MSIKIKNDEILNALYKIDFDSNETKEVLDFIEKRKIIDIMNISSLKEKEKDIKFFSEINKYYNEDNILNIFEKSLFNDMKIIIKMIMIKSTKYYFKKK